MKENNVSAEVEQNEWVVNCNKCGASLSVKNDGNAYICPVCNTLFRIQTGTRIVKDVTVKEQQVHVTMTESAVSVIAKEDEKARKKAKRKKLTARAQRRARKKLAKALQTVIAQNVTLGNYETGDVLVVDLDEKGVVVKKA